MKNCEKSADVVNNGSKSYRMARFHFKTVLALCTNLANVLNYSMVVGLKGTMLYFRLKFPELTTLEKQNHS